MVLLDNMSRRGSEENRAWLSSAGVERLYETDLRDAEGMASVMASERPDVVLHLAAQVAVTSLGPQGVPQRRIQVISPRAANMAQTGTKGSW